MSLRIVFMGTPDFAVPSLRILVQNGYKVVGVVTATDKYGGRGKKQLLESPVKKYAVEQGIPVLQPKNLKSPEFQEELRGLNANLQVVVAFRMLPEAVWDMPEYGTFNLHGSLLPRYRGAAPINWAVINGDAETGVTTFFIRHQIDTGDVLFQEKMPIGPNETAGAVHDRMMLLGAETVLKTVKAIESGDYQLQKQDDALATKAPKLFRETCEIDFAQPIEKVHNFVRGLSPYPAAWTTLEGKQLKILRAHYEKADVDATPGTFRSDNKSWIKIAAPDGWLVVEELQMQGRKRMKANDFLNGFSF
ncbi:MAG: methionyl-tRNA formyltransferase [Phaeodactylibacter xiamenensis]|nr:methionyl-tRNA formyltransferase [Phaeodactylibacter xiamenensis]MCR9052131.1 methionyl-tRNA formyltransferase [bacterium]